MKKLLIAAMLASIIIVCVYRVFFQAGIKEFTTLTFTHNGHSYIKFRSFDELEIVHDPNCHCLSHERR